MSICEPLACLALTEARKGGTGVTLQMALSLIHVGVGIEPRTSEEQSTLLATKPSLSSPSINISNPG